MLRTVPGLGGVDSRTLARLALGETSLLDGGSRTATVRAATPMRVLCLDLNALEGLLSISGVGPALLAQMARRLRQAEDLQPAVG